MISRSNNCVAAHKFAAHVKSMGKMLVDSTAKIGVLLWSPPHPSVLPGLFYLLLPLLAEI
jgi:hypothetical protein